MYEVVKQLSSKWFLKVPNNAWCLLDWPGFDRGELGPEKGVWVENLRSARASSLIVIGLKTGRGCAGHGGQH